MEEQPIATRSRWKSALSGLYHTRESLHKGAAASVTQNVCRLVGKLEADLIRLPAELWTPPDFLRKKRLL